ncbi:MAG: nucleotidyl transferase AbiEii/AbiGii toxin family protein [Bacillota bacterium]
MGKSVLEERDELQARFLCRVAPLAGPDLALKGGGALRFVYGSPRFSEDLDFDVGPGLPPDVLREKVRKILADLRAEYSEPKQTGTVQRWKLKGFLGLACKFEFSRRNAPVRVEVTPVDFGRWGNMGVVPVGHLGLADLLLEKIEAAMAPGRFAPRDAFDLFYLTGLVRARGVKVSFPEGLTAEGVIDKLLQIPSRAVVLELLPLLPRDMRASFDFDRLLEAVWSGLADLGLAQRDGNNLGAALRRGAAVRREQGQGLSGPGEAAQARPCEPGGKGLVL